ncbi:MAG TPA: putative transporter [Sutterella sp.]|nr:putative transporter [Sutterella sp.]
MNWLTSLLTDPTLFGHNMLVYCIVISAGLYLGRIKVAGISLGVTCVLFLGLIASYLGIQVDTATISFLKDFGLILFVFFIGLQVGPSFFSALRHGGYGLNVLMALGVVSSILITVGLYFLLKGEVSLGMILGVHFGAVTSTPGLGATAEALSVLGNHEDIAVGYACAYPFAVVALILTISLIRVAFRVDIEQEDRLWEEQQKSDLQVPICFHTHCTNPALDGLTLREIRALINRPFICSRILHEGEITSPTADTVVHVDDKLRIVATADHKQAICAFCGKEDTEVDLATKHSPLTSKIIQVTRQEMNGVRIDSLHLSHFDGVNITRVSRAGMTFFPYNSLRLQLGDSLRCVGPKNSVARLEALMGNKSRELEKPNVSAIFIGIALSIILANIPLALPGMPTPIRLGLAGGPLIIAILLGYYGPRLHLVTYTTNSANLMLREWGVALFLASIGLSSGTKFFDAFASGSGLVYIGLGLIITILPMLLVGIIGRKVMKLNFHTIAGLIAGTATSTPALTYAGSLSENSTAVIAYSTVYPLAMFLRIISGQLVLLALWPLVA